MTTDKLLLPKRLYAAGEVQVRTNGDGAKTAPVTIIASSGQPFEYPDIVPGFDAPFVWDHASVRLPRPKIPLDWGHDEDESIGWLSKMEASDAAIQVSGAIVRNPLLVPIDVMGDIAAGIPFQASCESHDYRLELVQAGVPIRVNGRDLTGPLIVCRDWELTSVAVCKYGKDDDTSVSLAASKRKIANAEKVIFSRMSKKERGEELMTNETAKAAVEATAEVVKAADEKTDDQAKVETAAPAAAVEAVEAKSDDQTAKAEQVEKKDEVAAAEQVDPRAEFKSFVTTFGAEKAGEYYAADMSMADAYAAHIAFLTASNTDMKNKLAAKAGGIAGPLVFSDAGKTEPAKAKRTMEDMIRMAGK